MEQSDIEFIVSEVSRRLESHLIERGDERYVLQNKCNERQERVNKKFANDDKRIEILIEKVGAWNKLLWAIAIATVGGLVAAVLELIIK